MNREYDLLVLGDAVPDVIVGGVPAEMAYRQVEHLVDSAVLTIGGSAAITACGAARLGLRVAFIGVIGDDGGGRFMLDEMGARGVDTSGMVMSRDRPTGLTVSLVRSLDLDRALLTLIGAVAEMDRDMVHDDLLRIARHVHVGSFYLLPRLAPVLGELFDAAHAAGLTTSLDTQGDPTGLWDGGLPRVLRSTDFYLPNESEATGAARTGDLVTALTVLASMGTTPVVKLGDRGAAAYTGRAVIQTSALDVLPVDTVGAGDTFDAGFLCGHLKGWPIAKSLALGAACGSLSTRAHGGVEAQPTLDEALTAMAPLEGDVTDDATFHGP